VPIIEIEMKSPRAQIPVLLRLNPEVHRQLQVTARSSGTSMQGFIELDKHIKSWANSDIPEKAKGKSDRLIQLSQGFEPGRRDR
jgi:hypothetical protein